MPHAEVKGARPLRSFHEGFAPRTAEAGGAVLKATGAYLAQDGRALLIDCLTVEGHLRQNFFALLVERPESVMVRLHPRTSPEKSEGVMLLVAWIARWVRADSPGATFGTTNLGERLDAPIPRGAEDPSA
jgi:hypothetical protein